MDHRSHMEREAAYEPAVRSLVRSVNTRLQARPGMGQFWVRIRPPTDEELVDERLNPRLVRFHRIGSVVKIVTALPDFVELQCGKEVTMAGSQVFLESWVKLVTEGAWDR